MSVPLQVLILGADTAVGRVLVEQTQALEIPLRAIHQSDWDLSDSDQIKARLKDFGPSYVINCLSTDSQQMSVSLAKELASICQALDIALVQLSSNCVFDQQEGEIFNEDDVPNPGSEKGQAALAVESAIVANCDKYLVLRVGWVFSSHAEDDVSRLLTLAQSNDQLKLSNDKMLCPTSVCDIATVILAIVQQSRYATLWGIYHYCSAENTTLFKFAEVLVAEARQFENLSVSQIIPDGRHEMNDIFEETSPKLTTKKILYTFGVKPKPWRQALSRVLRRRYQQAAA